MKKLSDIGRGLRSVLAAIRFIHSNGLGWIYIVIILLIIALFVSGFFVANSISSFVIDWLNGLFSVDMQNGWFSWVATAVSSVGRVLSWIITMILVCIFSAYIALIVLSPLFSYLAEKTIAIINGHVVDFSVKRLMGNMVRSLCIVLRNMLLQLLFVLLLLVVGLLPGLGLPAAIVICIVDAFFLGFSMSDYAMEVFDLSVKQSINFAHSRKALMIGIGLPYGLTIKVPFIGIYIALLIAPLCVVGAACCVASEMEKSE